MDVKCTKIICDAAEKLMCNSLVNQQPQDLLEAEQQQSKKPLTRSSSSPALDDDASPSALRYVLPIQRAETIAKINLKRTRTVNVARERRITMEDAKDHWINDKLMKKEDEFVNWQKST